MLPAGASRSGVVVPQPTRSTAAATSAPAAAARRAMAVDRSGMTRCSCDGPRLSSAGRVNLAIRLAGYARSRSPAVAVGARLAAHVGGHDKDRHLAVVEDVPVDMVVDEVRDLTLAADRDDDEVGARLAGRSHERRAG